MKKMMKRLKNERGLTLVELLAVIVILAIIAVIAFVMIGKVIENSKQDAHIANAQQLIASAKLYEAGGGEFTSGAVTDVVLNEDGYLDVLINPWNAEDTTYTGTVTKSDGDDGVEYTVKIDGADVNCDLNKEGINEKELAKGREICE